MLSRKFGNRMEQNHIPHENRKKDDSRDSKKSGLSDSFFSRNRLHYSNKKNFISKLALVGDQKTYKECLDAQISILSNSIIKELENEKNFLKIRISEMNQKMVCIEEKNSDMQEKIDYLMCRVDNLDIESDEKINEVLSEINISLKNQSDYSFRLYQESITHTNQFNSAIMDQTSRLFNILYSQIHEYIGVTDEKSLNVIREQIRSMLSQKYEYFPG